MILLRRLLLLLGVLCLVCLAGCSTLSNYTHVATASVLQPHSGGPPAPCPTPPTAKALNLPAVKTGPDQNIVYFTNEFSTTTNQRTGTLYRYDLTTRTTTSILKLSRTLITEAQLSADGRWILFVSTAPAATTVQMRLVRIDGQFLQTIVSTAVALRNLQWSTDQRQILFTSTCGIYRINTSNGADQLLLKTNNPVFVQSSFWLDTTHMYITTQEPDGPRTTLALLDTTKTNQSINSLPVVFNATAQSDPFCWDADSSYDASTLFINQCVATQTGPDPRVRYQGPSVISAYNPHGSQYQYLFVDQNMAITSVRAVTSKTLLFTVDNTSAHTDLNGLWAVGTDGSNARHMTTRGYLNYYSHFPWTNVSRDGNDYVLHTSQSTANGFINNLEYGALSGGTPVVFVSLTNIDTETVGWTTF